MLANIPVLGSIGYWVLFSLANISNTSVA